MGVIFKKRTVPTETEVKRNIGPEDSGRNRANAGTQVVKVVTDRDSRYSKTHAKLQNVEQLLRRDPGAKYCTGIQQKRLSRNHNLLVHWTPGPYMNDGKRGKRQSRADQWK